MKRIALLLAILVLTGLGCTTVEEQVRRPEEYQNAVYNATSTSPKTEDEVLNFLSRDKTDRNVWVNNKYMCQEFASDLWWNAYNEGIEACMVAVFRTDGGHWVVKFRTTEGWLWVEPHTDITSIDGFGYQIYFTLCGKEAFDSCVEDWNLYWLLKEYES